MLNRSSQLFLTALFGAALTTANATDRRYIPVPVVSPSVIFTDAVNSLAECEEDGRFFIDATSNPIPGQAFTTEATDGSNVASVSGIIRDRRPGGGGHTGTTSLLLEGISPAPTTSNQTTSVFDAAFTCSNARAQMWIDVDAEFDAGTLLAGTFFTFKLFKKNTQGVIQIDGERYELAYSDFLENFDSSDSTSQSLNKTLWLSKGGEYIVAVFASALNANPSIDLSYSIDVEWKFLPINAVPLVDSDQ